MPFPRLCRRAGLPPLDGDTLEQGVGGGVPHGAGVLEDEQLPGGHEAARGGAVVLEHGDEGVPEQFEILPGQPLPAGVIPPEFYEDGEGLMTWRHTVTDNGSFDLNPQTGAVTFRVCAVRVAEVTPTPENGGGGGGCRGGFDGGFSPLGWALLAPLGALLRRR